VTESQRRGREPLDASHSAMHQHAIEMPCETQALVAEFPLCCRILIPRNMYSRHWYTFAKYDNGRGRCEVSRFYVSAYCLSTSPFRCGWTWLTEENNHDSTNTPDMQDGSAGAVCGKMPGWFQCDEGVNITWTIRCQAPRQGFSATKEGRDRH
jgi:hypothetical protein